MQLARTPLAAFGVVLTTACALLFVLALGVEAYGLIENPYVGILIYGALPVGFAFGLALVFIGNLIGLIRFNVPIGELGVNLLFAVGEIA